MKLDEYLRKNQIRDAKIADAVGCNRSTIGRIRHGLCVPGYTTAMRIQKFTGGLVTLAELGLKE